MCLCICLSFCLFTVFVGSYAPYLRAYECFNGKPLVEYVRITKQIVNKSWRFHVTVLCLSLKTNWQRKSAVSTIESDFVCFGFGMRFDQWYTYIKPYQEFSNWFFFSMMLFSQKPFILFKQTLIWKAMVIATNAHTKHIHTYTEKHTHIRTQLTFTLKEKKTALLSISQ